MINDRKVRCCNDKLDLQASQEGVFFFTHFLCRVADRWCDMQVFSDLDMIDYYKQHNWCKTLMQLWMQLLKLDQSSTI